MDKSENDLTANIERRVQAGIMVKEGVALLATS
jgi:hypothetical protein